MAKKKESRKPISSERRVALREQIVEQCRPYLAAVFALGDEEGITKQIVLSAMLSSDEPNGFVSESDLIVICDWVDDTLMRVSLLGLILNGAVKVAAKDGDIFVAKANDDELAKALSGAANTGQEGGT